jgi:hypothetical protein
VAPRGAASPAPPLADHPVGYQDIAPLDDAFAVEDADVPDQDVDCASVALDEIERESARARLTKEGRTCDSGCGSDL